MKYCISCGNKLIDDAVFCPKCGTKQTGENKVDSSVEQSSQPTNNPKKKKKLLAIIIAAVAVVLAAVIITVSLLIIPKSFAKNVEYSKGASEWDSRFNMSFEQFLDKVGKSAETNFDYYKATALQHIDYDTSSFKTDFFDSLIGASSGKEFKDKICDKNKWNQYEQHDNRDFTFIYTVNSPSSNQALRMCEITVCMDDNGSDKITGVMILFGDKENEITQLQKTTVDFVSFVVTEALLGADKETSVICPLFASDNSPDIYVYKEVKFQTTPTSNAGVTLTSIEALSKQAEDEGKLSGLSAVTHRLTDDDINKEKTQISSAQQLTKTIPAETQQSTTQAIKEKESYLTKTDNELGFEFDFTVDSFASALKNSMVELNLDYKVSVYEYKPMEFADEKEKAGNKFNIDYRGYEFNNHDLIVFVDNKTDKLFQIEIYDKDIILGVIKTINPNFTKNEVENCYKQMTDSNTVFTNDDSSVTIKYLFQDNICYEYIFTHTFFFRIFSSSKDNYDKYLQTVSSNHKKVDIDTTAETKSDSDLGYTVEDFGHFYADVPKNWFYEVENGGISFYEEYNHSHGETGSTGYLCRIVGISPENSDTLSPNSEYLGNASDLDYYIEFPMGIGMIEDKTASEKMQTAHSQVEGFVESIIFK